MHDPFKTAARNIFARVGFPCVFTRFSTGERVVTTAILDKDVEIVDEVGNLITRDDMISLLLEEVGVPKARDTVEFTELGDTYTLGRNVRDDMYVVKLMASKNG